MRLTRPAVAALTLPPGKSELLVFDDALPGLGFRPSSGGKRTWIAQYRIGTKQRRVTLGTVQTLDLERAQRPPRIPLARVPLGGDPQTEKAEARARAAVTLGSVADPCLKECASRQLRPRSYEEAERHLTRHWAPLREVPLEKVKRANVATRIGQIASENGPFAANRSRASLLALFGWAMGEGLIEQNPVIGINKATEDVRRYHVVHDEELAAIWGACRDDEYGRIVRLLILTAQRREEVGGMRWAEIDETTATWTSPGERGKNGQPHEVPLSPPALQILREVPRRDRRALVFGSGADGYSGWSRAKTALDRRIAASGAEVRPWRLHDLRRTAATRMAELGTLPHVVEAVLNHLSGHKAGVAGIYNRATCWQEKRDALVRWADHVLSL